VNVLNLPAGPILRRVSIVSAYVACGVLGWLSRLPAEDVGAEAARGWLVFMALLPWLLIGLVAIRSGNQLGGVWKWLAWPPLAVPTLWFIARGLIQVDWQRLTNQQLDDRTSAADALMLVSLIAWGWVRFREKHSA